MMRYLLIPLGLVLGPASAEAQMLRVVPGTEDPAELHFDPVFIRRNGVRTVIGEQFVKREGEPMLPRKERKLYRFDPEGRTVYSNTSYGRPGTGTDTAFTWYEYDDGGALKRRYRGDLNGNYALEIELDSAGRALRETYVRIENLNTDRYHPVPGPRTEISDEHFRYDAPNDSTHRRIFMNNHGLVYREQWHVHDRLGYLRHIEDRYTVSRRASRTLFAYNEKGQLVERAEHHDLERPDDVVKRTFGYDAAGNLIETDLWHGDRQVMHEEIIYAEGTMFLKARISKDLTSGVIHVVRYTVERR